MMLPVNNAPAMDHIRNSEIHEVTAAKLAVDGELEQREVPGPASDSPPYADRPDFFELEGRPRPEHSAFIPRFAPNDNLRCVLGLHGRVPHG